MLNRYAYATLSDHALVEMHRRGIEEAIVQQALKSPDSYFPVREGRIVLHKTLFAQDQQKSLLYRIFLDIDREPPVVVTVYRTSKISKYERGL